MVKNLPAIPRDRIRSLNPKYPLEKEMAIRSSILACRIPRTKDPGRLLYPIKSQESDITEQLNKVYLLSLYILRNIFLKL